jgi:hypothetical protein
VPEPAPATANLGKIKKAFRQGEEKEAANLFPQLFRQSITIGLLETPEEDASTFSFVVPSPCGRMTRRAASPGSSTGSCEAALGSRNLLDQVVASVAGGRPVRGVERVTGKAVLMDGVQLTREIGIIAAIGIDTTGCQRGHRNRGAATQRSG